MKLSFDHSSHLVTAKLAKLMKNKCSNLAVSADLTTSSSLIKFAETVADNIIILKTHIDIISDYTPLLTKKLRKLANQAGFLIFEDRKFADIGNTVLHQVNNGIYRIAEWADIINAHMLPGPSIIDGLKKGCKGRNIGLLLLAEMSSIGNLFNKLYTQNIIKYAIDNKDFVMGFIAQGKISNDKDLITMTPGVNLINKNDTLGQNYNTPQEIIIQKKSDIIIVGRGIYTAKDPSVVALDYQKIAWKFYCMKHLFI